LRIALSIAVVSLCFAGPSLAEEQARQDTDARDEIVCRDKAPETGSRFGPTKECRSRRQWEERQAHDRRLTEQVQHVWAGSQ
jgi:hypothetical protein